MTRIARHRRGMTLIEILIAMAIMGLMMMIAWTTIKSASDARVTFEALEDRNQELRLGMSRITYDLESSFLSSNQDANLDNKRTQFVGTSDAMRFTTFGHMTLWADSNESDQTLVAYYLDDDRDNGSVDSLYRRELRRPSTEDWEREPGELDVLVRGVEKLELEYWDWKDKKWRSSWDSTKADGEKDRLPTRVRVTITYKNPRGDELKVSTQARLLLEERVGY